MLIRCKHRHYIHLLTTLLLLEVFVSVSGLILVFVLYVFGVFAARQFVVLLEPLLPGRIPLARFLLDQEPLSDDIIIVVAINVIIIAVIAIIIDVIIVIIIIIIIIIIDNYYPLACFLLDQEPSRAIAYRTRRQR